MTRDQLRGALRGTRSRFGALDRGATAVEYALLGSLIAVVISASVALLAPALIPFFQLVANTLP